MNCKQTVIWLAIIALAFAQPTPSNAPNAIGIPAPLTPASDVSSIPQPSLTPTPASNSNSPTGAPGPSIPPPVIVEPRGCPLDFMGASQSGLLVIGTSSTITTVKGVDVQCFSQPYTTVFTNVPSVAISITSLSSQPTSNLFFSAKPLATNSTTQLSLLVRTPWLYTTWSKVTIRYFAEDIPGIETGYWVADTGVLGNCEAGKNFTQFIPFATPAAPNTQVLFFINGFEITSRKMFGTPSPYEVQITNVTTNSKGVALTVSVTTFTQVLALSVSMIKFASANSLTTGLYLYDRYISSSVNTVSVPTTKSITGGLYGLTGFLFNIEPTKGFSFDSSLSTNQLALTSSLNYQYLQYSYFFQTAVSCADCNGYPFLLVNKCVADCPIEMYPENNLCKSCQEGFYFNRISCVSRCSGGKIWSSATGLCFCPVNTIWLGDKCGVCDGGRLYDINTFKCDCPTGSNWNGVQCLTCNTGRVWSLTNLRCECPTKSYWDEIACITCTAGRIWSANEKKCICPFSQNWNGASCVTCSANQIWVNNGCACPFGLVFNGNFCISKPTCTGGQIYNTRTLRCECNAGEIWTGSLCLSTSTTPSCIAGRIYDTATKTCRCAAGLLATPFDCVPPSPSCTANRYLSSAQICSCPTDTYWDGAACVAVSRGSCPTNSVWQSTVTACICPGMSLWINTACVAVNNQLTDGSVILEASACSTNQIWTGYSCESPSARCSGNSYFMTNPDRCLCGANTYWDSTSMRCVQIRSDYCPGGSYYNPNNGQCVCPASTAWTGNSCTFTRVDPPNQVPVGTLCPSGTIWTGANCVAPSTTCTGVRYLDSSNRCQCGANQFWNDVTCQVVSYCPANTLYIQSSNSCLCPPFTAWDGQVCSQPTPVFPSCRITTATFLPESGTCGCSAGSNWDGSNCIACAASQVWNPVSKACSCIGGRVVINNACTCPPPQGWNGIQCQSCPDGQIFDPTIMNCRCGSNLIWNGATCISNCVGGQIYTNGICSCPTGQQYVSGVCTSTSQCRQDEFWNGQACVIPQCPQGTYWNGRSCVQSVSTTCPNLFYWNGITCVQFPMACPTGSSWVINFGCVSNGQTCQPNKYFNGLACVNFETPCLPGFTLVQGSCRTTSGTNCQNGTTWVPSSNICAPNPNFCTNGKVWSTIRLDCVCPSNSFATGDSCVQCSGGRNFENGACVCPAGTFFNGNACATSDCSLIPFSVLDGSKCLCLSGFKPVGMTCQCDGLNLGTTCDQCGSKPNSIWISGLCVCKDGFTQVNGKCVDKNTLPAPPVVPVTPSCSAGYYFDNTLKRCNLCGVGGCMACTSCYTCTQCQPGFYFVNPSDSVCTERCGDGKRFILGCDDGNNIDGDGCSRDCKVEPGFMCTGGSPTTPDSCSSTPPTSTNLAVTGQAHIEGAMIFNLRLNYIPLSLLMTTSCLTSCANLISVDVSIPYMSINQVFLSGSSYSIVITIKFGMEPIAPFQALFGINQEVAAKYYSGINTSQKVSATTSPAFMSIVRGPQEKDTLI